MAVGSVLLAGVGAWFQNGWVIFAAIGAGVYAVKRFEELRES